MKKLLLLLFLLPLLTGCSEENVYEDRIVLYHFEVKEGQIDLKWSKLDNQYFDRYLVVRTEGGEYPDDIAHYNNDIIAVIENVNQTSYTDHNLPHNSYLSYSITGVLNYGVSQKKLQSNKESYLRPEIIVHNIDPFQVTLDEVNNHLYFFEKYGKISIFDYENEKIINQIDLKQDFALGFSGFGSFENRKELYVPAQDKKLLILDASTLEKIDEIELSKRLSSVASSNGKLFISTDDWSYKSLKVYDRATKSLINETGYNKESRIHVIPGRELEFIETPLSGEYHLYYKFDPEGNLLQSAELDREYPQNASIFEFFPGGDNYITSRWGAIYSVPPQFQENLPADNFEYTSFAFNQQKKLLYAGLKEDRHIRIYSTSDFSEVDLLEIKSYPTHLISTKNELIVVGRSSRFPFSQMLIEKFSLSDLE